MKDRTADFRALASVARIDDVNSPEAVVLALYDAISGPAGEERDWERIRSLFDPAARLLIGRWLSASDTRRSVVYEWDVDAFIQEGREYWLPDGFWERQLAARTEVFGKIAHVFSAYESRMGAEASPPIGRGVNSVQLLQHAERWWIISLVWDVETPGHTVPTDLRFED